HQVEAVVALPDSFEDRRGVAPRDHLALKDVVNGVCWIGAFDCAAVAGRGPSPKRKRPLPEEAVEVATNADSTLHTAEELVSIEDGTGPSVADLRHRRHRQHVSPVDEAH